MIERIVFTDVFDQQMATEGPPGLFTLTHEGELQFDLFRTRDWKRRFHKGDNNSTIDWNHCVMIDIATGWPMYCLVTGLGLVGSDERTTTIRYETFGAAQSGLLELREQFFQAQDSMLSS